MLDRSGSVGSGNHELAITFIKEVAELMDVSLSETRVGMIAYDHRIKLEFDLDDYSNINDLKHALDNVKYTEGSTATGEALKRARKLFNPNSNEGARRNVPHMLVLLTGMSVLIPCTSVRLLYL